MGIVRVESLTGEEGSQVDDKLFGARHEAFGHGAVHLVGVELLVQLLLQVRVLIILREERLSFAVIAFVTGTKAGRHGVGGRRTVGRGGDERSDGGRRRRRRRSIPTYLLVVSSVRRMVPRVETKTD
jgi:hypothetical protein